jgi:ribosome biogenesis GTPase A
MSATIQWYPGHIAKAEKALREQLDRVDVVFEVRDARIPLATTHPQLSTWLDRANTPVGRVLVLNRVDAIAPVVRHAWERWFREQGEVPYFTDAKRGKGVGAIARAAQAAGAAVNERRRQRGMRPRPIRAAVIGFPNVGKSALINRLLKRRVVESAAKPGVTRQLRWVRLSEDLDLLDAPGVLPANLVDQAAAVKLALCDDIGQAAYDNQQMAAELVELAIALAQAPISIAALHPESGLDPHPEPDQDTRQDTRQDSELDPESDPEPVAELVTPWQQARAALLTALRSRHPLDPAPLGGERYVFALGEKVFQGDAERAARSLLHDFRRGTLGAIALEWPPEPPPESETAGSES